MNRAEELFRRITESPKSEIEAMVNRRESEDTWLDFKAPDKEGGGWPKVQDLFSKAASGFSNTDGGLIIWGVTTKKKANAYGDLVDAADGFSLIPDPTVVSSGLDNEISRATFPANPGIVNTPIVFDAETGAGVVVTYIPLSPLRPLQRAYEGTKDFKMRAGDSFIELPYQLLAGMFGRYPAPEVRGRINFRGAFSGVPDHCSDANLRAGTAAHFLLWLELEIENIGTSAARGVYISARTSSVSPDQVHTGMALSHWDKRDHRAQASEDDLPTVSATLMAKPSLSLAPGETVAGCRFVLSFPKTGNQVRYEVKQIRLEVTAGADGAVPHRLLLSLSADEVRSLWVFMHREGLGIYSLTPVHLSRILSSNLP